MNTQGWQPVTLTRAMTVLLAIVGCSGITFSTALAFKLPLEPTRTIEFMTTEGTHIGLDVSPDGTSIVFHLVGDLYRLPINGGDAVPLTSGMAWDSDPKFSPDGQSIAFISDRSGTQNLWVMNADGTNLRNISDEQSHRNNVFLYPEWLPEGDRIFVFKSNRLGYAGARSHAPREPWTYAADGSGGEAMQFTIDGSQPPITGTWEVSFTPDGRYMYIGHKLHINQWLDGVETPIPEWQLAVMDRRSGEVIMQTDWRGGGMSPVVSPDGHWLVYGSRVGADTGLRLRNLKTGSDDWFVVPVDPDEVEARLEGGAMQASAFTPDSRFLVLSLDGKIKRIEVPTGKIDTIPFRARVKQQLGPLVKQTRTVIDAPVRNRMVRWPTISPDGSQLAFIAQRRLWLVDLAGGTPRRLAEELEASMYQPVWTPDGQSITFAAFRAPEGGHLYTVPVNGRSAPRRLTRHPAAYFAPAYAPDGERLAFIRYTTSDILDQLMGGGAPNDGLPGVGQVAFSGARSMEVRLIDLDDGDESLVLRTSSSGTVLAHSLQFLNEIPDRLFLNGPGTVESVDLEGSDRRLHVLVTGFNPTPADSEAAYPTYFGVRVRPGGSALLSHAPGYRVDYVELPEPVWELREHATSVTDPGRETNTRRLSEGEATPGTIGWSGDGKTAYYALGHAVFRHGIDSGEQQRTEVAVMLGERHRNGTLAMRNANIVTMGPAGTISDGVIVIDDNRIASVGREHEVDLPPDATIFDLGGKTIAPGLVDSHCHIGPAISLLMSDQPWPLLNYLAYGVTTCREIAGSDALLDQQDAVRAGLTIGPRFLGSTVHVTNLHAEIRSLEDAYAALRPYAEILDVDTIKQYVAGDRAVRQTMVIAGRELGLHMGFEGDDTAYNMTHVIDGYASAEHSISPGPIYKDYVEMFRQSGTGIGFQFLTLRGEGGPSSWTYYVDKENPLGDDKLLRFMPAPRLEARVRRRQWGYDDREHVFPFYAGMAGQLHQQGLVVGVGDHGEFLGIGMHWEVYSLATGTSTQTALEIATIGSANLIGYGNEIGSIEPGKLADLIVLENDPTSDVRALSSMVYVVKGGTVYDAENLNTVWPERRQLPEQWWRNAQPRFREGSESIGGFPKNTGRLP